MRKLLPIIVLLLSVRCFAQAPVWAPESTHVLQMSNIANIVKELPRFQHSDLREDWHWHVNLKVTLTDASGNAVVVDGMVHGPDKAPELLRLPKDTVLVFIVAPVNEGQYSITEIDRTDGVHQTKDDFLGLPFAVTVTK